MRLPRNYWGKPNTQIYLANGLPTGPNIENPIQFGVCGKVLRSTDNETEIETPQGRMILKSDIIVGAQIGSPTVLQPTELPKNKAGSVVAKAVPQ